MAVEHDGAALRDVVCGQIAALGYAITESKELDDIHVRSVLDDERASAAYKGECARGHDHSPFDKCWWQTSRGSLTIASRSALAVAFALGRVIPSIETSAFLLAMLVGLVPIATRAISAASAGTPFSIEMLITIAGVGAAVIGATEEAATVLLLFLIGELLEGVAAGRARAGIQDLTKLVPKTARLEQTDGQVM